MEKNHLINGKVIFPKNLKLKKNIRVGIIGSGKIALEYIRIIKSFHHSVKYLVTFSKNKQAYKIAKKNKAKLLNTYSEVLKVKDVDIWIVCTSWDKLKEVFYKVKKINKPVLFEKGMAISYSEIKKIINSGNSILLSKVSIAYNRNYYDYIFLLSKFIKKNQLLYGNGSFFDPYKHLKKTKNIPYNYLPYYITSHWISLILKLFKISGIKILKIKKINNSNSKSRFTRINFLTQIKGKKISFEFNNFPDLPDNHIITFFFKKHVIKISPIEKMSIYKNIKILKKNNNNNKYLPEYIKFEVNKNFKPGMRYLYYDFINHHIFNKTSILHTNLKELAQIYKICELLK